MYLTADVCIFCCFKIVVDCCEQQGRFLRMSMSVAVDSNGDSIEEAGAGAVRAHSGSEREQRDP